MDIGKAALLGVVQGLTEFLPVSSSGHLVLGKYLLGLREQGIEFEVFVHFGTLLAVLTVFRSDIWQLIKAFFSIFTKSFHTEGFTYRYTENSHFRLLVFILVASIPAAVIGLTFEKRIERIFGDPHFTCLMLLVTAFILFMTFFVKKANKPLTLKNTFLMGVAQAFAILPGISRSGSTISMGLYFNVNGSDAARFSFILAVPAIFGATILKSIDLIETGVGGDMFMILAIGMIAAYISGFIAIESMLAVVRRGKLYYFAPYCLVLGLIGLIFI